MAATSWNKKSAKRVRGFVFTLNNYSELDEIRVQEIIKSECVYGVYGREVGQQGTPHLQGVVEFKDAKTQTAVAAILKGAWVEPRKGTPQEAADYCKKSDANFWEYGKQPVGRGARSDMELARHGVREGLPLASYADQLGLQALKYNEQLLKYRERERDFKPIVVWIYGPTGTGKTMTAREMSQDPWVSMDSLEWWEGYDAHKHVIIDDFRASYCRFVTLLRILDRYPCKVPNKGGSRQLLAEQMIITSVYSPAKVYSSSVAEDMEQLMRRIDIILYMDADGIHYEKHAEMEYTPYQPPLKVVEESNVPH